MIPTAANLRGADALWSSLGPSFGGRDFWVRDEASLRKKAAMSKGLCPSIVEGQRNV